eukprot:TRINITY_DN5490_c0_g1_i1.p1 TRINITY_DN5490_c0_g1~~TRINITY_DN5490_c0_g1_i1.p1  ORF type:complete len:380 (-),score=90.67 TRINITY_DN5490_c0_g1_i1:867-2006(-)
MAEPLTELRGILFAQFDVDAGPVLRYQYPPSVLSPSAFDNVSEYVITKPFLCDRDVQVCIDGMRLLGHPMSLSNTKYPRNELRFNVLFALDAQADASQYIRAVKKFNEALRTFEEESESLFRKELRDERVPPLLRVVFERIQKDSGCIVPIDDANSICIKLTGPPVAVTEIAEWQVPVLLRSTDHARTWDLALQRVLPHIDGVNNVSQIAQRAEVDSTIVQAALRHLQYYNAVMMVDVFQFSNVYAVTPQFRVLCHSRTLLEECAAFCQRPGRDRTTTGAVLRTLAAMRPGVTMATVCQHTNTQDEGIDEQRLVLWALRRGILRRVHVYPVMPRDLHVPAQHRAARFLDGTHSMDEICTSLACHASEVGLPSNVHLIQR